MKAATRSLLEQQLVVVAVLGSTRRVMPCGMCHRWLLNCSSYCDTRLESYYFFKEMPSNERIPVLLQRTAELSPPSHILYTLIQSIIVHLLIFCTP